MTAMLAQFNGAWLLAISAATLLLGIAGGLVALIIIPGNYFSPRRKRPKTPTHRPSWKRIALRIGKNIVGILFLTLGIFLSLPLVPGPGIIFLVMGISLVDMPRKRRMQRYLISRPFVLRSVNKLRAYWHRPKLVTS